MDTQSGDGLSSYNILNKKEELSKELVTFKPDYPLNSNHISTNSIQEFITVKHPE